MPKTCINMVKLCVGAESVDDLVSWQQNRAAQAPGGLPRHVTRMWPKRESDLTDGGSLYWVIKGVVLARQRIRRLEEVTGEDGITRCGIVLDPAIIRTRPQPRRPFQGWRYLRPEDSPADLPKGAVAEESLPPQLQAALAEIGVL